MLVLLLWLSFILLYEVYIYTRNKDGVIIDRHALFAYRPLQLEYFFFTENVISNCLIFRYAVPSSENNKNK